MTQTQLETAKDIIQDLEYKNAAMTDIANLIERVNNAIDDIRMESDAFSTAEGGRLLDAINQINLLLEVAEERRDKIQTAIDDLWKMIVNRGGEK